ncbi:unnamed protein product, partial [Mesorhabditis belari]|uniref:Uncharacterized protein n=1 Tax=Mesorhabditis belari TaxID=2138241 RepID=A0AAF3FDI5_9BILA
MSLLIKKSNDLMNKRRNLATMDSNRKKRVLMLFTELMFDSPAYVDGQLWSAEDVAKLFRKDLVDSAHLSNLAKWEEIFRKGIHYDAKRIKMIAQRLASPARESKRDGIEVPMGESIICEKRPEERNVVIGVGGSESSFIYQTAVTGVDWLSPKLVPIMLLTQYLSQTEGPIWRAVQYVGRGSLVPVQLMLFTELMFDSPAYVDGQLWSAEDVAKLFRKDLVDSAHLSNLAKWEEIFRKGIHYDAKRIKMIAQRLASPARESKRDGIEVASSLIALLRERLIIYIILEKFHERVVELGDSNPDLVVSKLNELRSVLLDGGVPMGESIICEKRPEERNVVIGVGGSESSFIYQTAVTGVDWLSPKLVPIMLLTQYLSQTEGPIWRAVRGDGLAYGVNIYTRLITRQLHFHFIDARILLRPMSKPRKLCYSRTVTIHPSMVKNIRKHFGDIVERPITSLSVKPDF